MLLLGRPITGVINMFGGCASGVWCLFGKNILHGIGNLW